jgi:hypothetical protein
MKRINTQSVFSGLIIVLLLFTGACSPKMYNVEDLLFYRYVFDDDGYFWFKGHKYCNTIKSGEIHKQPLPVVRYLLASEMGGKPRIYELYLSYSGKVSTNGWRLVINKKYRIEEHCSAMEPRFDAIGKTFPVEAYAQLSWFGLLKARILKIDLLKGDDSQSSATSDLCVLDYLSKMVWYPTAFLSPNITWYNMYTDSIIDEHCIGITIADGDLTASGKIRFDSVTSLPIRFDGSVTNAIDQQYATSTFSVTYSGYEWVDHYRIPSKCVASITDSEERTINIEMKLDRFVRPDQYLNRKSFTKDDQRNFVKNFRSNKNRDR